MSQSSPEALFRYLIASQVLALMMSGKGRRDAVQQVAASEHLTPCGKIRSVALRTVYRWTKAFEQDGIAALEPRARIQQSLTSALPKALLDFIAAEKSEDPKDSIPELIRRARALGIIAEDLRVDRTTVYRQLLRMGAPVKRRRTAKERDSRRFAYPHRMDMVLSDGKHFRAGTTRAKRVALFFLDDATRKGLHVVVGPSESKELFLRGLYEMVSIFGFMSIVYLDHGPGFIASETITAVDRLGALLIHGRKKYPEGHGKVERFNQTAKADIISGLDGRPDVDPACGALELRLQHYLKEVYDLRPHRSLDGRTPAERFFSDPRPLRFPESDSDLRSRFVVFEDRRVSKDHVVSIDSVAYEVPRGHAGERVTIHRQLLDGILLFPHEGKLVQIHEVDLHANARARRRQGEQAPGEEPPRPLKKRAADLAFDKDFRPVVSEDGGCPDPDPQSRTGDLP